MKRQLSDESRAELAALRAKLNAKDGEELRYDSNRKAYRWYRADQTDHLPETLPGFTPDADEQEQMRQAKDEAATVAYLHRDPADAVVLRRWHRPSEELDELEQMERDGERAMWRERFTALRETQMLRLLTEYFGTPEWKSRNIVLRWEPNPNRPGKFRPAEQMPVLDWIAKAIADRDGDRLRGLSYCVGHLRSKVTRRKIARDCTGQAGGWWKTYDES
jgi:hypothetical protein